MRNVLILILSLIVVHSISAQTIISKNFRNTEWFSNNTDSLFFKCDTIRLIKYSNIHFSGKGYTTYYESESLNDVHCVHFQFKKNGNMHFWIQDSYMSTKSIINERTWLINRKTRELKIFRNGVLEFAFKPISVREIKFTDRNQNYLTTEFTMLKNK